MACLKAYRWPGNVRELQNVVERLSILCPGRRVEREDLPVAIGERRQRPAAPQEVVPITLVSVPRDGIDLREHLGNIEKQLIRSALDQTDGTVAHAARLLGLQRTTLVEKLRKYELQARVAL
jgi:sigma-54 specific flagellar transcriptional regulator A